MCYLCEVMFRVLVACLEERHLARLKMISKPFQDAAKTGARSLIMAHSPANPTTYYTHISVPIIIARSHTHPEIAHF